MFGVLNIILIFNQYQLKTNRKQITVLIIILLLCYREVMHVHVCVLDVMGRSEKERERVR